MIYLFVYIYMHLYKYKWWIWRGMYYQQYTMGVPENGITLNLWRFEVGNGWMANPWILGQLCTLFLKKHSETLKAWVSQSYQICAGKNFLWGRMILIEAFEVWKRVEPASGTDVTQMNDNVMRGLIEQILY